MNRKLRRRQKKQQKAGPQGFERALAHHQAGRLAEAEAAYREVLAAEPEHPQALHLLGVIAHQAGHHEIAVSFIRQALGHRPDYAEAHNNLGNALMALGRWQEAALACREASR